MRLALLGRIGLLMIVFSHVCKAFGAKKVLDDFSLTIPEGGVHFIVGFSGAGKSVLIRHAIGLLKPDKGKCFVDEMEVSALNEDKLSPVRERCQMVFQHANLFDSLSLAENVAMPMRKRFKMSRKEAAQKAIKYLEMVDCEKVADELPAQVGSGVQKRVAIARAMALKPRYILYDEPTTGLSPKIARHIDALISRLAKEHNVTAVVVSHDMTSVKNIATAVSFLYETKLYFNGSVESFFAADLPVIKSFVNRCVSA